MKKEVIIGLSTILLVATPVLAAPGGKAEDAKSNHGQEKKAEVLREVAPLEVSITDTPTPSITITLSPTVTESPVKSNKGQAKKAVQGVAVEQDTVCDPNAEWKNHGAYVSCVAKTHPGGEVVSAAARSDIGKKQKNPSVTPSVSPTGSPSATPTDTPTPTPITSAEEVLSLSTNPVDTFIKALGRLLHSLPFFNKHS